MKSFTRKTNLRVIYEDRAQTWDEIFSKNNITNIDVIKNIKSIPKSIVWFGKEANIPTISSHLFLEKLFKCLEDDYSSKDKYIKVVLGLLTRRTVSTSYIENYSQLSKEGIKAFDLYKGNISSDSLVDNQNKIFNIAISYFGVDAYNKIDSKHLKTEDIILWAWGLDAKKKNHFIDVLELISKDNKQPLDTKYIIENFKTNWLLKKQSKYIAENWIDFNTTLISSSRFKDDKLINEINDDVPLLELEKAMHLKTICNQLVGSNRYINWLNDNKKIDTDEYITYKNSVNLSEVLAKLDLPTWGLKFALNLSNENLAKKKNDNNTLTFFSDLKKTSEKFLLEKSLVTKDLNLNRKISKI